MFFRNLENLMVDASRNGKIMISSHLSSILKQELNRAADMTKICPEIDSYMHEVEKNLTADAEFEGQLYSEDANRRRLVVADVVGDNRNVYYMHELDKEGWSQAQIDSIICLAVNKYVG